MSPEEFERQTAELYADLIARHMGCDCKHGTTSYAHVAEILAAVTNRSLMQMLRSTGRRVVKIPMGYGVHHINGQLEDNRLDNLQLVKLNNS